MEFRILGPLEVVDGDRRVPLPRGRGRALLALLVLQAGQVVSTERLIDELWGETPPRTATTALAGLVSNLRRRLEPRRRNGEVPRVLQTRPPGYVLAVDPQAVDANHFRRLIEGAKTVPPSESAPRLRQALALWRGPALADVAYEPFAQARIAELEELRLAATEERLDADLALGRHHELAGELQALAAEHPLRERIRGHLMLALYRSGRQADALEVFRDARRTLVDELGIEPGPALHRLEQTILRQDPALDLEPVPAFHGVVPEPSGAVAVPVADSWLPQGRKMVTAIFIDLAESTSLGERLDPEALRRIVGRYFDTAADVLTRHGGTIEKFIGDAVVAIFGVPTAHEDDALRAVRAAVDLRQEMIALNEELERDWGVRLAARAGINTGEVVVGDSGMAQTMASGDAINVAARLQQAAEEGEVLLGETTWRLVRDATLVEPVEGLAVKGKGRVPAWKVLDVVPDAPAVARGLDAPMIGRATELAELRAAFERSVRERTACRFAVLGEAGIGKSRLGRALAETLASEAVVLTGHCPAYGEGITFWPLREIALQAAGEGTKAAFSELMAGHGDGALIADQIAGAIGLTDEPGRADELFSAVRRFFEILAAGAPVMVVLEDLHWAQPTLLDLMEYLAEWTREAVFFLCLSRTELLEERPGWGRAGHRSGSISLEPLGAEDTDRLIADRLAGRTISPELVAQIVRSAQGNPLFLEQLLAALDEEQEFRVPPSVQALLAARLDRLGPAERELIRCASVVGTEFATEALRALLPDEMGPFTERHLQALVRKELVVPAPSVRGRKGAFSFRHVLIQQAAYGSATRAARATLHERFADWLVSEAGGPTPELEEILGYHLEHAHQQWRELGLLDERVDALAMRAGELLAGAGARAYARYDVAAAENLLSRAKLLLTVDHPQWGPVLRRLAEVSQVLGRHDQADAILADLVREVQRGGASDRLQDLRLERARIRLVTGPDPTSLDAIREEADRAVEVFGSSEDDAGVAQALAVLALVHQRLGDVRLMEEVARRGLVHAERSGQAREELIMRTIIAWAVTVGPTSVADGIRQCEELVFWRGTQHPLVLCQLATLRAMLGEFDDARDLVARARLLAVEQMRVRRPLMFIAGANADVEILAGDLASAGKELRTALEIASDMGEPDQVSQMAARLSRVLAVQVQFDEAEQLAGKSEASAPGESVVAQALWRAAKARAIARERHDGAERLAQEAVDLIPTQMLNLRADLLANVAAIALASGEHKRARSVMTEAIALYERKGNITSATRTQSLKR